MLRWVALLAVLEVARMTAIHFGALTWTKVWVHMQTLLRANLLAAQVASGGPEAGQPVGSAGEAITHFRDDAEDVAMFVDGIVDVSAGLAFTMLAGAVLGVTNPAAAAVLVLPLITVGIATKLLDTRIKAYRLADREATAAVTGLVGDVMAAATTVKVNDAGDALLARLERLVEQRRATAVRDRVLDESLQAFSRGAADVGLGAVLLVAAGGLASGQFGVGDLALFAAYLGWLSFLPRMIGRVLARRKQAEIAFDRMRVLVADRDPANTVRARELPIGLPSGGRAEATVVRPSPGAARAARRRGPQRPVRLGRRCRRRVVHDPARRVRGDHRCRRVGQEHAAAGAARVSPGRPRSRVRCGGTVGCSTIGSRSSCRPTRPSCRRCHSSSPTRWRPTWRSATSPTSGSGRPCRLAVMDADLADMPDGIDTLIGPRGLRLSGGQRQRLAGARAVVHDPELVVLDDLSSALDVETELRVWQNLAEAGMTVLAVSHRAVAFERADQVLRLEAGRLVDGRPRRDSADGAAATCRGRLMRRPG